MNYFKKYTSGLRGKLLLSAMIPLIGFFSLSTVGYFASKNLKTISSKAYTEFIPNSQNLGDLNGYSISMAYYMWMSYGSFDDDKRQADAVKNASESLEKYTATFKVYSEASKSEEEKADFTILAKSNDEFINQSARIISLLKKNAPDSREEAIKEMTTGAWAKQMLENRATYGRILTFYKNQAQTDKTHLDEISESSNILLFSGGLMAAIITFTILLVMSNRITQAVIHSSLELEGVGKSVNDSIVQLASAGQGLSQSSTANAASLEETVASLEEMTSMIKLNSENADQAYELSTQSMKAAEAGESQINNLLQSMNGVEEASKKISEIINVIDDIAFQTNLLALNASVEAARAGEHGKGFAVVAEAVRSLSQRSAVAAKDIGNLIQSTQDQIQSGNDIAQKSGAAIVEIVSSVRKVTTLVKEISASTGQQASGIQQVGKAMNQIDSGTQSNAASAEEISATVEDIASLSQKMQSQMLELNKYFQGH